jgi:hypothetical protein
MLNLSLFILLVAVLSFPQHAIAQEKKADAPAKDASLMRLQGYVVDAMCAKGMAGKENIMKKAAAHTKTCALEDGCAAAGYGLFSDGKWYKFDDTGDKQAKAMIEKSTREKGLAFEVNGKMTDGKLAVASMKEIVLSSKEKVGGKEEHKHKD